MMHIRILGEGRSAAAAKSLAQAKGYKIASEGELCDLAILSPGIPLCDERVLAFKRARVPVIGEMEFGLRHLKGKALGVTGTNGKTTTVALCEYMLKAAGKRALACGNNGYALCQALVDHPDVDIHVIEMSSYQLETASSRVLDAAVVLNVTPDHLDRYASFEDYRAAKMRIVDLVKLGGRVDCDVSIEKAAEHLTGLDIKYAEGFQRPAHRLEFVKEARGIKFINDSKGTNVESVLHAVKTLEGPLILLAGGLAKGGDFTRWLHPFKGRVKQLYVFGQAADAIEMALRMGFAIEKVNDLKEATKKAFHKASVGDTIVLSPGCSSFDQFRDFEHRGDVFKQCVQEFSDES